MAAFLDLPWRRVDPYIPDMAQRRQIESRRVIDSEPEAARPSPVNIKGTHVVSVYLAPGEAAQEEPENKWQWRDEQRPSTLNPEETNIRLI